jgi:hypothetical protein
MVLQAGSRFWQQGDLPWRQADPARFRGGRRVVATSRRRWSPSCGACWSMASSRTSSSICATTLSRRRATGFGAPVPWSDDQFPDSRRRLCGGLSGACQVQAGKLPMKLFGIAGYSGSGKTTLMEKLLPRITSLRPARLGTQARAPQLRYRSAGQGLLSSPPGGCRRGAAGQQRTLGVDERVARRS